GVFEVAHAGAGDGFGCAALGVVVIVGEGSDALLDHVGGCDELVVGGALVGTRGVQGDGEDAGAADLAGAGVQEAAVFGGAVVAVAGDLVEDGGDHPGIVGGDIDDEDGEDVAPGEAMGVVFERLGESAADPGG